ncbi:alpha/beta fold hydrolase [Corynebacterium cystitidis]|uniref:Serine aminopeptidase, S33 n=1 Tax=Corynebacterium cystitidis DSM 20524 TaxID=1121357 RepID=A0A1H9W848_9CORY|nr:alpha/beta hydrolase [Corynebacterium cystitidis]WJY83278.1 Alpha/beta hydrolase family protein [Corynebacterium cystitidis DSM 20524]SES30136.1 Serine aminopeptidase, S33 [Corynebacterium cystitidis DSM 20524]SNV63966.1 acetoin dehydrogenase E2 subunit dihydrolipoyllysine-residue acetyltransferase [Corynebacterium cystitidis]
MSHIVAGSGPTVVLLHGIAPRFTDLSDPFGQLVDDCTQVLNDEGPCFLIGHSMGGAVAAEAALRRPDLVRALVLEDPAWVDRTDEQTALNGEARVRNKQARMVTPEGWDELLLKNWATGGRQPKHMRGRQHTTSPRKNFWPPAESANRAHGNKSTMSLPKRRFPRLWPRAHRRG